MKKLKDLKKSKTFQIEHNQLKKKKEKDIIQPIGSFNDFLIMEKKDNIKDTFLEFEKVESDNNFLNDFLILEKRPKQEKSRFSEFFKEIKEQEEKQNLIEEPKIEEKEKDNEKIEPNIPPPSPQSQNQKFDSSERKMSYFSLSQYQNPNQKYENNNYNNENKLYNTMFNFSNNNSRSTSISGFTGHGNSFSIKSTNTIFSNYQNNNIFNRNSINSVESNNININNQINNINNNPINNNNKFNIFPNNKGNMNLIYNNNPIILEKEFEPIVDIKKILSFEDKRTTIMIKNIPNKFTREKLIEIIDKKFKGTYDLFILPKDGNKNRNFGYSFINFLSSYSIPYFYSEFNGKKWVDTNSLKICEITYSKYQGRNELIAHYPNKIIYFNDVINVQKDNSNNFFIPSEYKLLFKQLFPNQQIEENESGFITKIPFRFGYYK